MSEEANLFREIVGNLDDLDSRLVYADLLEDRGDPRGEFIRVRRIQFDGVDHYINKLENWIPLQRLIHVQFRFYGTSLGDARNAVVISGDMPKLKAIALNENGYGAELLRIIAQNDGFQNLQAIDLEDSGVDDHALTNLISNSDLCRRLVWLNLAMNRISMTGVRRLAQYYRFENLGNLRLRGNLLGEGEVNMLRGRFGRVCDLVRLYERFEH